MSKQSEAKEKQGYVVKGRTCVDCARLESDKTENMVFGRIYVKEKNLRCALGEFAVKKMGTCNEWKAGQ